MFHVAVDGNNPAPLDLAQLYACIPPHFSPRHPLILILWLGCGEEFLDEWKQSCTTSSPANIELREREGDSHIVSVVAIIVLALLESPSSGAGLFPSTVTCNTQRDSI